MTQRQRRLQGVQFLTQSSPDKSTMGLKLEIPQQDISRGRAQAQVPKSRCKTLGTKSSKTAASAKRDQRCLQQQAYETLHRRNCSTIRQHHQTANEQIGPSGRFTGNAPTSTGTKAAKDNQSNTSRALRTSQNCRTFGAKQEDHRKRVRERTSKQGFLVKWKTSRPQKSQA